jgi:protein-L-isoaspartate(D-aspartate) O-methyltransferase
MVRQLRQLGIRDERVLSAMGRVPREEFVRWEDREVAYGDHALPIEEGQTISQPYIVARMTELLDVDHSHHVLEVGTGSGYQAAVLAELAGDVVSVERHGALARTAGERLARLGYTNVRVIHDDASLGRPEDAPYERIVVTAGAPAIDPALAAQLTPNGRLVAPVGDARTQELVVRDATGREERHGAVRFVPLRGRAGFQP